jgi:hypothetical protein
MRIVKKTIPVSALSPSTSRIGPGAMRAWPMLLGALLSMAASSSRAADSGVLSTARQTLQIHGFASQAYMYSTGNNFLGSTTGNGRLNLTEVGLNASTRPLPNLQLSGQALFRRAGESDNRSLRLDYGIVDYGVPTEQGRFGLRLGRVKNPVGLYNETRDVAFARPSVLLPQSIYFDRVRNLELASDGGQLYGERGMGSGELMLQVGAGAAQIDSSVEQVFFGRKIGGDVDGELLIGRLLYEKDGGALRLGVSGAYLKMDVNADPTDAPLTDGHLNLQFWVFSAQYNAESWSLTAEYLYEPIEYRNFEAPFQDFTVEGGYLQGTYRFAPHWQALLRYDVSYSDADDHSGKDLAAVTGQPPHNFYTKDWTFGIGWEPTANLLLRAEYHRLKGANWITAEDNHPLTDTRKSWDLFALQASFRF